MVKPIGPETYLELGTAQKSSEGDLGVVVRGDGAVGVLKGILERR